MVTVIIGLFKSKKLVYKVKETDKNFSKNEFLDEIKLTDDFANVKVIYIFDDENYSKFKVINNNIIEEIIDRNIFDFEIEQISNLENNNFELPLPTLLYHATVKSNLKNIKKNGLGFNTSNKLWDSEYEQPNVGVFLADAEDNAFNFVESSDFYDGEEEIIIFEINLKNLDLSKIFVDSNIIDNLSGDEPIATWFYNDIIPFKFLNIVEL